MTRGEIGFVTGLAAEAGWLRGHGFMVGVGGGGPDGAARAARGLVVRGAAGLVSFGLAGGLDPAAAAGALVVPRAVREAKAAFVCDPALSIYLGGANAALMLAGSTIAATVAAKAALFAGTGATAVDLESGAVARAAAEAGLPFAVLRAISDPAAKNLPPAALVALDDAGAIKTSRIIESLLRQPSQLPTLLALARDTVKARKALLRRLQALG